MKVVILAGGYGTRLAEETDAVPKPMVRIGGMPILWHIMKIYSHFGLNDFIVCLGYRGYMIKEYFANYFLHVSDVTFDLRTNDMTIHQNAVEPWRVTLIDTGEGSMTGGRLKRVRQHVGDETFAFTYGDGVADVNIADLLESHARQKTQATVTIVPPPARFGALRVEDDRAVEFMEKPYGSEGWVSAGFFILEPSVFDLIDGDATIWEREPMESLAQNGQLSVYRHPGFWQPMDTLRDKRLLDQLWDSGTAPWKVWP